MPGRNDSTLLGNGINYLSYGSVSWKEFLISLSKDIHNEEIMNLIDEKPFLTDRAGLFS